MTQSSLTPILDAVNALTGAGSAAPGEAGLAALSAAIDAAVGEHASTLGPASASVSAPAPTIAQPRRLGALSERYESGGRGPGTVSSGRGDPGGVSYGLYQMASRTGTVAAFIKAEGVRWSRDFIGREPGTASFTAAWEAVAARDPAAFADAQHAFIERTHYRPAVAGVKAQTGLDLDARSTAVRDACWSCAVQHGGAVKILSRAVVCADAVRTRGDAHYDRELVEALYAVRSDYVRRLADKAMAGERRTMLDIAGKRYPAELAAALALLDGRESAA